MAAHLYRPITDAQGNLRTNSVVALYTEHTSTLTPVAFFADEALTQAMPNPFDCPSGIIDVYCATPVRVDVGVTPAGGQEVVIHGIDADAPGGGGSGGPWTPYTPVATASGDTAPTFAPDTLFGRYQIIGNALDLSLWCGNAPSAAGVGAYRFGLPPGMTMRGDRVTPGGEQYQVGQALWIPNGGAGLVPGALIGYSGDAYVLLTTIEGSILGDYNFPPGSGFYASGRFEVAVA